MHVIFDARLIAEPYSGLGRYTGELLFSLLDRSNESLDFYTVIVWDAIEGGNFYFERLKSYQTSGKCNIVSVPCRAISFSQHFTLGRFVNQLGGDVYLYCHFDLPLGVRMPAIHVVHDLSPIKVDGYITKNVWLKTLYFKLILRLAVRKAKYIFAVSETTRKDLLEEVGEKFGNKIGVSYEGPIVKNIPVPQQVTFLLVVPDQFLLYVGVRRPHKNLKRIIDLFVLLKEKGAYSGCLVLAGSTKNYGFDVERYIGSRSDIVVLGMVDDNALATLYQRMDALIFLSKYEGFGLPVVEAGLFGKKMIVSDGGALPEVAPPWAFVLPNEMELIRSIPQIKDYLDVAVVLDDTYVNKYNWDRVAQLFCCKFRSI